MSFESDVLEYLRRLMPDADDPSVALVLRRAATLAMGGTDRRLTTYLMRVRIYDMELPSDPQRDSQPNDMPDAPPTHAVAGLANVATETVGMCWSYIESHPRWSTAEVEGLDSMEAGRRIENLRPQLSRKGGIATWRLPFKIGGRDWLARVDVVRA